ncbi:hypothetical protein HN924_00390 [Candidatus Woesearchaeota archaeon]|jgi:hypothetical protein|nr:hypothetical protein [Candidatus Woesearchaeota archaeon]MBT7062410.1 hypothetical protein [Candidatus Woesearchaeota archaeon]MBT7402956.1 hypothetical protein [Candidatus Woesearchaeota archaeon]
MDKKGAVEWYWIIIGIIIVLIVALFILGMFTDFGVSIKSSFTDILGLADTSSIPTPSTSTP